MTRRATAGQRSGDLQRQLDCQAVQPSRKVVTARSGRREGRGKVEKRTTQTHERKKKKSGERGTVYIVCRAKDRRGEERRGSWGAMGQVPSRGALDFLFVYVRVCVCAYSSQACVDSGDVVAIR